MITPTQSRMARGGLKWTVRDLAVQARVSVATVIRFENSQGTPIPATAEALQRALELGGVEFRGEDGVRLPGRRGETPEPRPGAAPAGRGVESLQQAIDATVQHFGGRK